MLCESYGARIVVICGGFVFGLGCVISAFATSLQYLYLSFSLLAGMLQYKLSSFEIDTMDKVYPMI